MSQKNKAVTAPQIITNGIWTAAVLKNFVVNPHEPFDEYSGSSTYYINHEPQKRSGGHVNRLTIPVARPKKDE